MDISKFKSPIAYYPRMFAEDATYYLDYFLNIDWENRTAARREAFFATSIVDYTYGTGEYARTYTSKIMPDAVLDIGQVLASVLEIPDFELCFLNYYDSQKQALGWHADDAEMMDHTRPIAVVSFGAEREIWTKPIGAGPEDVEKVLLNHGSAFIMKAGMQHTHVHKIPKHDRPCGPRISLTYRGLKTNED